MRIILAIAMIMVLCGLVYAVDVKVTVPDAKVQKVVEAFKNLYPIPQIPDPSWVDPKDNSLPPRVPKFTDAQWVKECVKTWVVSQVARYEQIKAQQAIKFQPDDTLVQ
ncbi:MAG: hypothetical protein PHX47_04420 [Candidatus ainarchaeum sp.]|nr:hypothetical protein [Candidatus ainarchaeum sp.]